MATYDAFVSRSDAASTIPEEVSNTILNAVQQESVALQVFPQISMGNQQTRLPVLSVLPQVYWGSSDTSLYQTSEVNWDNKYIDAAELYCLIPMPNKLIRDESIDLWSAMFPNIVSVMSQTIDATIFLSQNVPAQWTHFTGISAMNTSRSTTYNQQASVANGGIAEDFNQTCALVEAHGYPVNFAISPLTFRRTLRSARDTTGQRLMELETIKSGDGMVQQYSFDGVPLYFGIDGAWTSGTHVPQLICGDRRQGIVGMRTDMETQWLREAVFFDSNGKVTLNLAQQDMTCMKLTFRMGFQVANQINLQNTNNNTRWCFATLNN